MDFCITFLPNLLSIILLLATFIGCFVYLHREIKEGRQEAKIEITSLRQEIRSETLAIREEIRSDTLAIREEIQNQVKRTDRLYEMFIALLEKQTPK